MQNKLDIQDGWNSSLSDVFVGLSCIDNFALPLTLFLLMAALKTENVTWCWIAAMRGAERGEIWWCDRLMERVGKIEKGVNVRNPFAIPARFQLLLAYWCRKVLKGWYMGSLTMRQGWQKGRGHEMLKFPHKSHLICPSPTLSSTANSIKSMDRSARSTTPTSF